MRRHLVCLLVSAALVLTFFPGEGHCLQKPLYEWLIDKASPVKAYVLDVTDSSGVAAECVPLLKKNMEEMLVTRKKISFALAPDAKDADMVLACDIVEFFWTDSDPIDEISGIGPIAMDAALKENYGRLTAVFTITDPKSGREVWHKKLKATYTGNDITKENCAVMISERMMKVLTKGALTKPVEPGIGSRLSAR